MLQSSTNANAFASTFYFLSTHNKSAEKNIKSLEAIAPDYADDYASLTRHNNGYTETRTDNKNFAKVAFQCFTDTFVVNQILFFRIKICGENCNLRHARNRFTK